MNRIFEILKKYMIFIAILTGISIVLGISYSNFIVTSGKHKAAEMYIGTLKYSMTIDGTTTNTLSVPAGETIIDVTITNENPIDTYYKLIYQNNSNVTIKYYEGYKLDNSNNISNSYDSPNDKLLNSGTKTLKLKIVNNSTTSQTIIFKVIGGFATNTLDDVTVPSGYTIIGKDTSTNTYFCTTIDTLTQGLKYVNGQCTYVYKQQQQFNETFEWKNITTDGWGAELIDSETTEAVTSKICSYINNKPLVSTSFMFFGASAEVIDLSTLNTNNVINMEWMFGESQTTTLDVSTFDTSKVTDMNWMFSGAHSTTLNLSNFDTSKVTNMSGMFSGSQATTLDLSSFDTSKVIDMSGMFFDNQSTTLDVNAFDTHNVTNMNQMFSGSQATTLDLSNFDTSKVTDMGAMFSDSQATTLDLSNFDTSKVTDMSDMFNGSKATTLDLSSFDTSNVINMGWMFYNAKNLKTIYASDKFNTNNVTESSSMFINSTKLVGGKGTKYNSSYIDKTYARIDGGTSNPGYFTDIADKPKEPESFATDSWVTISNAVKNNNTGKYNVGDTKTIDMGTYGTHTLRIANKSTPSECSTTGFSQTACGFVLEFADIITTYTYNMKNGSLNEGGWPASDMHTFVNNDIYNALPSELRNLIIVTTVVSGHGNKIGETNFTSTDKLYLLSTAEVWAEGDGNTINYDTARDNTRQLDYYKNLGVTTSNYSSDYSGAIKNNGSNASQWWLRPAASHSNTNFYLVGILGGWSHDSACYTHGVSPAFRIG